MKLLPTQVRGSDIIFSAVLEDGTVYSETFGNNGDKPAQVGRCQDEFLLLAAERERSFKPASEAVFLDPETGEKITKKDAEAAFAEAVPPDASGA